MLWHNCLPDSELLLYEFVWMIVIIRDMIAKLLADAGYIEGMKHVLGSVMKF
jgi:hypothetical protein